MNGTEWRINTIAKITDGDTLRAIRSRTTNLDGRNYTLTDADLDGTPIRLAWVNTPERGKPGYTEARNDLAEWVYNALRHGPLRVICYESAGWDRLLGDLIDSNGESASQWMMRDRGWAAYDGGKA
jgi:endonuclease YncB( thermonuclease family)